MTVAWYERPEILTQLPASGHVVLEASAGTGKTYALEHLVIDLLLAGEVEIEEILVVTFTEKATEELRTRLRTLLLKLSTLGPADDADPQAPPPNEQTHWRLDEVARERLRDAVVRFDAATISTIHGFCQRILTEEAFAHRRLFEQQRVEGAEAFARSFRDVLRRALAAGDPSRGLLERWWREEGGDLERLEKVVYDCLRERGEITPSAPPDLREAVAAALAIEAKAVATAADLAIASPQLSKGKARNVPSDLQDFFDHCRAFLSDGDATAFGAAFQHWAVTKSTQRLARFLSLLRPAVARQPEIAPLLRALEAAELVPPTPFPLIAVELARRTRQELQKRKRALGLYDFDDMLLDVHEGLCGPGADPQLARSLRRQIRCALIDEFQDTDAVQWAIFRALFFDPSEGHRLFLVGDPKQAIYAFRGADVHTYREACREIEAAGGSLLPLDRNYRSTAPMVEACNRIFGNDFFTDPEAGFREVSCGRPHLRSVTPPGEEAPVCLIHLLGADKTPGSTTYQAALGAFIARETHRLVEGGALRLGEETPEPIRYRDVHVLTRSAYEGRQVGEALARLGIPHAFYRQEGLFATDEARDLLALLRAVVAPEDASRRLAAWLTPFFGVPLRDLASCSRLPDSHPLVARLLEWHHQAGQGRLGGLLRALARDSGLARRLLVDHQGDRELTIYLHLLDLLLEEAHRSPCTLEEMVSRLEAMVAGRRPRREERDLQPAAGERDAVQILTMHKAKGLEAAVVFLAGGFTGPSAKTWDLKVYRRDGRRHAHLGLPLGTIAEAVQREALEEDQRLLYVAVTRARARVYLPYFGPPPRGDDGHNRECNGTYLQLAQRLEALRPAPDGMPERLFRYLQAPCEPAAEECLEGPERSWRPEPRLLLTGEPDPAPWLRLQRERRGALVTSYTRLHRHREAVVEGDELSVFHGEAGHPRPLARDDELPPGRASGIFLHHLLETADRQAALAAVDAHSWARRPEVAAFLEGLRAAHGIEPRFLAAAHLLAFAALRTSIWQPGLDLPGGFAEAERQQTEMEFLFPIPEPTHPSLQREGEAETSSLPSSSHTSDPPPYRARRGYVRGVVDLVFEHRGRTFFLDWKSDLLPDYGGAALTRHVEERYQLQAQLYALAVVRLLRITGPEGYAQKFGGLCYCFVRGLEPEGTDAGLYFRRPEWEEVVTWERELRERERW